MGRASNILARLELRSQPVLLTIGLALIAVVGNIDVLTGYELSFSVFYTLPITFVTWLTNRAWGLRASILCSLVWFAADHANNHPYSNSLIPFWNALIRLAFFVIITLLVRELRQMTDRERSHARIDSLTGAANSRFFYSLAQMEIDRCHRYERAFTLAYIDLDDFKVVNDRYGHPVGDQALQLVVSAATECLRKSDVVARLGGDEFALLFPETDQASAATVLSKVQLRLAEAFRERDWPISVSVGVVTCQRKPPSVVELMRLADDLMYAVKRSGKDGAQYLVYEG